MMLSNVGLDSLAREAGVESRGASSRAFLNGCFPKPPQSPRGRHLAFAGQEC